MATKKKTERKPRAETTRHRKRGETSDWGAVREHWLVMNLDPLRDPRRGEYSLKEAATAFRITHKTVRNKASEQGWRGELNRRRQEIATASIDRAQATAIAVEAKIREEQIKIAQGLYTLLGPVIKGYQRRVSEDPHNELVVDSKEMGIFVKAMAEARSAAGFGSRIEVAPDDSSALERIARHREDGALLVELLDEISGESTKH